MKLAIVGSTNFVTDGGLAFAEGLIRERLATLKPELVISGGAIGIDQLAAQLAREAGIPVLEHLPKHQRWEPDGFKERNLKIAEDCTHLLAIRCKYSKTYGSGWTAERAMELGRRVKVIRFPAAHTCHARGCEVEVPPEMLMCRRHWFMVPGELRRAVWNTYRAGQCDDKQPSMEWFNAADAAIRVVYEKEKQSKK